MDSRLSKLVELCQEEIDATAKYAKHGPSYRQFIADDRYLLSIKIADNLEPPKWEDPNFWNSCIIKSLAYRLANLKVARACIEEKRPKYVSDVDPLAIQIVQSLSVYA